MYKSVSLFLVSLSIYLVSASKDFSLARFNTTSYANNSVIHINLVGEGFEGSQITDGGALECHTDDITCCRGIDNPSNGLGRGEWYYPNETIVPPPGSGTVIYRTRDHMVLRLNRGPGTFMTGDYSCVIPGAGGVTITRNITLENGFTCTDLPGVTNGQVTYTPPRSVSGSNLPDGQRYTGTIATYSCSSGYQLVGGSSLRSCGPEGNWNGTEPTCEVDCGLLTDPTNGQVDTSSGTTFGRTATYTCNPSHALFGSSSRTCGADGMWTPDRPMCTFVDCGPLTDPTNGQVDTSSGTTFGSTATYTCNDGYTLSGSSSRACGADGMWTSSEPECEPVDCGPLTNPTNGQVDTSSGTTFESVATYTCNTGYTLSGSSSRTCGADGMWTSSEPECERVIIQIRLEKVSSCIDYITTNPLQKVDSISETISRNLVASCLCRFNSSFILESRLQCFDESPQIVTFRTQLSETSQTSTIELVSYIEQWIGSSVGLVVNGIHLNFDKNCPLVISSFDSEECPISTEPTETDSIVGGITAAIVLFTLVVIIAIVIMCVYIKKRHLKTTKPSVNQTEVELQQTAQTVRNSGTEQAYGAVESPAVPVKYEEIDEFLETRGNSEMIEHTHKGDYEYTECPAYNPVNKNTS